MQRGREGACGSLSLEGGLGMTATERERLKLALFVKQKGRCADCRVKLCIEPKRPNSLHLDHLNPRSNGGTDEACNRRLLCLKCNIAKSDSLLEALQYSLFDGRDILLREPKLTRQYSGPSPGSRAQARLEANRKASGWCKRCPSYLQRPARPGKTLCQDCHERDVDRVRRWRQAKRREVA